MPTKTATSDDVKSLSHDDGTLGRKITSGRVSKSLEKPGVA